MPGKSYEVYVQKGTPLWKVIEDKDKKFLMKILYKIEFARWRHLFSSLTLVSSSLSSPIVLSVKKQFALCF